MRTASFLAALMSALSWYVQSVSVSRAGDDRPTGTIAFSSLAPRGWDLYVTDVGSRQSRRLTDHRALDFNAAIAPDGERVAFVSERDGNEELYSAKTDGSELHRLTDSFALDDHPAWSPDGRRIAFSSTRQPAETPGRAWNAVYVLDVESAGDPRRLTPLGCADYSPAWSHDGRWIAVASGSGEDDRTDLYVMAADGSGRRPVIANAGWPAFSADGGSLFFHSKRGGKWGVWRIGIDGSGLERITPSDIEAFTPSTSRDGKSVAVAVRRDGNRQIALINLVTRSLTDLTDAKTDHWNPALAPDGRSVVYHKVAPETRALNVETWGRAVGYSDPDVPPGGSFPGLLAGWPACCLDRRRVRETRRDEHRRDRPQDLARGNASGTLQRLLGTSRRPDRVLPGPRLPGTWRPG